MKFDIGFTVQAVCNHYKDGDNTAIEKDIIIELELDQNVAQNFIFRFAPSIFIVGEYKVVLKFDAMNVNNGVVLMRDDDIFVVKNFNQFLGDIVEGYIRTRTTYKILNIMEFDFETALEDKDVVDEFDLKEN